MTIRYIEDDPDGERLELARVVAARVVAVTVSDRCAEGRGTARPRRPGR